MPEVPFATYQEVDSYTDSLAVRRSAVYDKIYLNEEDKYKDEFKARYVAAAAEQTCSCLASFDLNFVKRDDYVERVALAQANYDSGEQTEAESKLIAFNQLLNVYGNLAEDGSIIKLKHGNNYKSVGFSMLYSDKYKAEVEKQCGELRKEIIKVHNAKYMHHGLLEHLRN